MSLTQDPQASRRPRLRSPRLRLRDADADDAAVLHTHWNRPPVRRYLWDDELVPETTVAAVLARSDADFDAFGFGAWVVEAAATGWFVGYCGLRVEDHVDAPELLYSLEPVYWGQGFATEAAVAVLSYAFDTLRLARVVAGVDPPNDASRRVLARLGARPLGEIVIDGRATPYYELAPDSGRPRW